MARAVTTLDVFSAVAEPRRREIIDALAGGARAVGDLVRMLRLPQPAVSKHLGVLRQVGLVSATKDGQRRLYRLNAQELRPLYDWSKGFEQFWDHRLERIKESAERMAREAKGARDTGNDD